MWFNHLGLIALNFLTSVRPFSLFFKGRTVAIKRLNKKTVHMTREILIQLKQVSKYISL